MFKKIIILCLSILSFNIKSTEVLKLSNIKIYFENKADAKDLEKLIDKDEELFMLNTLIKPTGNDGYYLEISGVTDKQFKSIKSLKFTLGKPSLLVFTKDNQCFAIT